MKKLFSSILFLLMLDHMIPHLHRSIDQEEGPKNHLNRTAMLVLAAMPYFLSFAAGAMLYVVVEDLIPEMSAGEHSNIGVVSFATGFSLMMMLDVALG